MPNELNFSNKKFSMILYGTPGCGKTTTALSAPKPILIDFDKGISRVKAYHRTPSIQCTTYEEVLNDIHSDAMKNFETVVIDTGGSFVTYLQDWAMRQNPAVNKMKNGQISLKGHGEVKAEFKRFTSYVKDVLNKNIIYVFHSEEQKDKDGTPQQRLLCEGSAKNIVWQPCDFGGYVQMIDDIRTISFTPTQEYFAKGCFGIEGRYNIPVLNDPSVPNDFLTRLFEMARKNIEDESKIASPEQEIYEKIIAQARETMPKLTTVDDLNETAKVFSNMAHVLTSKKETGKMLNDRAKELGCKWNKTTKQYEAVEE